jgi:CspA family cold shock protein
MSQGMVKWFDKKKGYGFIEREFGGDDIFVHFSAIRSGKKYLSEGDKVIFDIGKGRRGLKAVHVTVMNEYDENKSERKQMQSKL